MTLKNIKYILLIIARVYLLVFILYSILGLIDHLSPSIDFSTVKSLRKESKPSEWKIILLLGLKSLIIAPVIEELMFRKPMKFSKISIIILLLTLLFSIITLVIKPNLNFYFLGTYVIFMLGFYFFFRKKKIMNYITLIFTSLVFGIFHVNNIETIETHQWYLYIYKIFPLIILGFGLGVIRLKLNTLWSIVGHSFFNLIPFFFKYIM